MADPFIAEVRVLPFNFAPKGWASCDGQVLPISQNTALFSLLGTTYGGDGRTTFALPRLGAHFVMGPGQGPGLTPRNLGEDVGISSVALTADQMPSHNHDLKAGASGLTTSPAGAVLAPAVTGAATYRAPGTPAAMAAGSVSQAGSGQPHENRQPYLGLMFCIALQGVFPPRGRSLQR